MRNEPAQTDGHKTNGTGISISNIRKRVYEIIEESPDNDKISKLFNHFLIILIILNVTAVIVGSFNITSIWLNLILIVFDYFSVVFFTIEYILRIWTAPYKYKNSRLPYLKYIFSFMAVIDLLSVLPFYLPLFINFNLKYLRILRLFRLFRILKLNRYNQSLELIGRVIKNEKDKLIMSSFIIMVLLLFASSTMFYIENEAQPDKYTDILTTLWWAVATLTTIGYGDIYPVTSVGKLLGGVVAILGIALVALPSGIITSGLIQESNRLKRKMFLCPHCGKEVRNDVE